MEHVNLFDRMNKHQGGALSWRQEDKDTLVKLILEDKERGYRKAIYVDKRGRSTNEALNDLVRVYCTHFDLEY